MLLNKDTLYSAKAGVIYGALSGIATWTALTILANRMPDKKVTWDSVILATSMSMFATIFAILLIKEAQNE